MKVQRIRFCVQCEEALPRRCAKCVKHPDRRPRVVELFGVPAVLATNECGCVKIRCQRPGCLRTMWRHPLADGTLARRNHFCSPACGRAVTAAAKRAARVAAPCSCGCGRQVVRPASNMRAQRAYYSQRCHYLHRAALLAQARRRAAEADDAVQAYACYSPRCRGAVTDHTKLPGGAYACVRCHARGAPPSVRPEAAGRP